MSRHEATPSDSENPEWSEEDFARSRPASELPPEILRHFPRIRLPPRPAPGKVEVSLALSEDVLCALEARSRNWPEEIDDILRTALAG